MRGRSVVSGRQRERMQATPRRRPLACDGLRASEAAPLQAAVTCFWLAKQSASMQH
jgi:hypothetical protein